MSQSKHITREVGAIKIFGDTRVTLGSTSEAPIVIRPAPTTVADADTTLTVNQVKTGVFVQTPSVGRILTLPTAALMKTFLTTVGACVDISVINLGVDTKHVTVAAGTGGSVVGSAVVRDSSETTAADSGSAVFRVRMTNVTASSEAYVVYRVC
jgi:hypothetical protein